MRETHSKKDILYLSKGLKKMREQVMQSPGQKGFKIGKRRECKGPEVGMCLWCSGNRKEARVAGTEVSSEKYQGPEWPFQAILRTWLLL